MDPCWGTLQSIPFWRSVYPDTWFPILICGYMIEEKDMKSLYPHIWIHRIHRETHRKTSSKCGYLVSTYVDTCFSSFKLKIPEDSRLLLEELLCFGFARYENTHMDYEKRKDSEVGHVINRQQWRWAVPDHTVFFFKQLFSPRVVLSSPFRHLRMTV